MAIKLTTTINKWLQQEANNNNQLEINEYKTLTKGHYYDLTIKEFQFCLILTDLKDNTKIQWIFHREFNNDEINYWKGKYNFQLLNNEGKYVRTTIEIKNVENNKPVKVVMNRTANTLRIFKKDLKWITIMGNIKGETK